MITLKEIEQYQTQEFDTAFGSARRSKYLAGLYKPQPGTSLGKLYGLRRK